MLSRSRTNQIRRPGPAGEALRPSEAPPAVRPSSLRSYGSDSAVFATWELIPVCPSSAHDPNGISSSLLAAEGLRTAGQCWLEAFPCKRRIRVPGQVHSSGESAHSPRWFRDRVMGTHAPRELGLEGSETGFLISDRAIHCSAPPAQTWSNRATLFASSRRRRPYANALHPATCFARRNHLQRRDQPLLRKQARRCHPQSCKDAPLHERVCGLIGSRLDHHPGEVHAFARVGEP
jgi:hypothetical protein